MEIETVCTGDELLTGLTADTNSTFLQARLLEQLGQRVRRSTVVGDRKDDIVQALQTAAGRSDVVLVTGGLGPTADDLTAECAAALAQEPLREDEGALQHLQKWAARHKRPLADNNRKQALVPLSAEAFVDSVGTAPMFTHRVGHADLFYLPGVPREYRHWVEKIVLPRIEQRLTERGERVYQAFALLKTVGQAESVIDDKIAPVAAQFPQVEFGFRTHLPENHVKLLARGATQLDATALLDRAVAAASEALKPHLFGRDDETFAGNVLRELSHRNETVACAESLTGGRIASLFTAVPSASRGFTASVVTYTEAMKQRLLGITDQTLKAHSAVSEAVAQAMAQQVRERCGTTYGLSATGYAGPEGSPDGLIPVGTTFVGLATPDTTVVRRYVFPFDRERNAQCAAYMAIDLLRRHLAQPTPP